MRKNGLFVKSGEVRRALMEKKSMYILYNKEIAALDSNLELLVDGVSESNLSIPR